MLRKLTALVITVLALAGCIPAAPASGIQDETLKHATRQQITRSSACDMGDTGTTIEVSDAEIIIQALPDNTAQIFFEETWKISCTGIQEWYLVRYSDTAGSVSAVLTYKIENPR